MRVGRTVQVGTHSCGRNDRLEAAVEPSSNFLGDFLEIFPNGYDQTVVMAVRYSSPRLDKVSLGDDLACAFARGALLNFRFRNCEIDVARQELRRAGAIVHVEPQ